MCVGITCRERLRQNAVRVKETQQTPPSEFGRCERVARDPCGGQVERGMGFSAVALTTRPSNADSDLTTHERDTHERDRVRGGRARLRDPSVSRARALPTGAIIAHFRGTCLIGVKYRVSKGFLGGSRGASPPCPRCERAGHDGGGDRADRG